MRPWFRRRKDGNPAPSATAALAETLRRSGLVDGEWYNRTYPDVAAAGLDPVEHYVASGASEGRNPNRYFDSAHYLEVNDDVREAGLNPLFHYVISGAAEGRNAGPDFDTAYYVAQNPEVGAEDINPLAHYLLYGQFEGRTAVPFDEGEAFEAGLRAKQMAMVGPASALFRGPRADHVHFPLPIRSRPVSSTRLPLPPLRLAQRIGSVTLEDFEESGREIRDAIVRALPHGFVWDGSRCLDFGSGVGRALRHFDQEARRAGNLGLRHRRQQHPLVRPEPVASVPLLPDRGGPHNPVRGQFSFDLVYAISVLSHIHTTWHQWLMEIRRILKPGGTFFVSFMGQTPMEEMLGEPYWTRGSDFGMYVKGPHQNWNDGGPMIFVSPDWIKAFWGTLFDIDYIAMEGLMGYQSFCVLRKPAVGTPIRRNLPVLKLGSQQAFDPDATGRLLPQIDKQKSYRASYGLDLPPSPTRPSRAGSCFGTTNPRTWRC